MTRNDLFKFFKFESIAKTKDQPYKEWVGEADNEVIVINYKDNMLIMGYGFSEVKARSNMEVIAQTQQYNQNLTLEGINKQLNLEWILPSGYFEE